MGARIFSMPPTWCCSRRRPSCWRCSRSTSLATHCATSWTRVRGLKQACRMIVGVISDTHGLLRPEAVAALRGSEHIIHAGDIGAADIIPVLQEIAPVTAIRGNVDLELWAMKFPETEVVEIDGRSIYVIHNLNALDLNPHAAGFAAVISCHSHKPKQEMKD